MHLSIIVPAYNEEKTLSTLLLTLMKEVPAVKEVIVVDDGSQDHTAQIAEEFSKEFHQIHLIKQPYNQGKTAALRTGFAASTGEIVLVQDETWNTTLPIFQC